MNSALFLQGTGELILTEKGESVHLGPWEGSFTCTVVSNGSQAELVTPSEFVPDWPLFGLEADQAFLRRPATAQEAVEVWGGEGLLEHMVISSLNPFRTGDGALAMSDYLATIPEEVRRVAEPFGEAQWLVMETIHDAGLGFVGLVGRELAGRGPSRLLAFMAERFIRWRVKNDRAQILKDFFHIPDRDRLDAHLARLVGCFQPEHPQFRDYEGLVSLSYSARAYDEVLATGRIGEAGMTWVHRARECCVREVLEVVEQMVSGELGRNFLMENRMFLEHFAKDMTAAYYPWKLLSLLRSIGSFEALWEMQKVAPERRSDHGRTLVANAFLY